MGKSVNEEGFCAYSGPWWMLALPGVILPVHGAIFVGTCAWATVRAGGNWGVVPVGVLSGFGLWTLFEYAFHRWVLHHTRHPWLRKFFWDSLHREHHQYLQMKDPDHHGVHLAISLPIALLVVGLAGLTTTSGWGLAVSAGWTLGYWLYEGLHWLFHSGDSVREFGRWRPVRRLWTAHTVHHLHRANRNYGFITVFWDKCFGTYLGDAQN